MAKKKGFKKEKLLISLVGLYILGLMIFTVFTIPTTKVNGSPVGFRRINSLSSDIGLSKPITIKGKEGKELTIKPEDINYSIKVKNLSEYDQDILLWPIRLFKPNEINMEVEATYNYDSLKAKLLDSFIGDAGEDPENAKIDLDESGKYIIVPEKEGSKLDFNKVIERVIEEIEQNPGKEIVLNEEYKQPNIKSDNENLIAQMNAKNKLVGMKITYDFYSTKEVLEGKELIDLYDEVDGKLVANKERSRKYLIDLAIKYDTFGSKRKFKAKDIGEITVEPGIYGWEVAVDKTNEVLLDHLNKYESADLKPIYRVEGVYRDDYNDIGSTYVEVDLGRQHMWLFKEGELVYDSQFVSGKDVEGRRTPVGVHQLWSKQKDTYLTGATWRSHVNYWMPIDWSGVGFHDASWRGSFGGNIYKNSGSHGCLNMPPNKAKEFYNIVELNTPVVVYDSSKF